MSPAVSAAAAGLTSTHSTLAPSRAKATAVALPLPQPGPIDPAPTTIATLPSSRSGMPCPLFRRHPEVRGAKRRASKDAAPWLTVLRGPLRGHLGMTAGDCYLYLSFPFRIERAQLGLEDLAVVVLRQALDEHVILRPLEARDRTKAQGIEFRAVGGPSHIGDDDLAPFRIRPADHRGLAHVLVLEQHFLDLARIDVGAAGDDHVLGAVLEREIALRVERADVAGVQPAAAQRCRARFRVAPITRHHHVAAAQNLPGLAGRQLAVLRVGDLDFDARIRPAGGRQPVEPARIAASRDLLTRERADRHRALALAVDLRQPRAESFQRLLG